jgi:alkanesulfonate monooxygenase SsuD/methylene tetrahydromethanopterin reductase-like flavin-dependent oxidoreductase (luciferase family)
MLDAGMVAAGTPEDVLEVLERFQGVGVDQIIMHMQMGGVPHDDIMRTIEILGTEVLPKLR